MRRGKASRLIRECAETAGVALAYAALAAAALLCAAPFVALWLHVL